MPGLPEACTSMGNTLDRWYRRVAVVVWSRDLAFAARAEAGSQQALSELHTRVEAGDLERARAAAESLAPFWRTIGSPCATAGYRAARGSGPGRGRDGGDAAGAVPGGDGRGGAGAGWRLRPGCTARSGRAGSSTGDSDWGTTARRTGTSGCGEAAGAVRGAACRRRPGWRGCCSAAPGAGCAASCGFGQPPRGPRSASRGWRC